MTLVRQAVAVAATTLGLLTLAHCSSSSTDDLVDAGGDTNPLCYPDNDGVNNTAAKLELVVDDTGFTPKVISTQNSSPVTLKLTNTGKKAHGLFVGCTTTEAPAGCDTRVCFPKTATIAPLQPGESKTITIETPVPDGIIYPFTSNEPGDDDVAALNDGQWNLM